MDVVTQPDKLVEVTADAADTPNKLLWKAAKEGNLEKVRTLVEEGAEVRLILCMSSVK